MRRSFGRSSSSGADLSASERRRGIFRNRNSIPEDRAIANDESRTATRRRPSSGKNNRTRRWAACDEKPGDRKGDDCRPIPDATSLALAGATVKRRIRYAVCCRLGSAARRHSPPRLKAAAMP